LFPLGAVKRARISSEQDAQKSLTIETEPRTLPPPQQTNTSTAPSTTHAITAVQLRSNHVSFNFKEKCVI
jgi:hypothetical protein